jgi:hypothetical protein
VEHHRWIWEVPIVGTRLEITLSDIIIGHHADGRIIISVPMRAGQAKRKAKILCFVCVR